jgi:hypothetical protein
MPRQIPDTRTKIPDNVAAGILRQRVDPLAELQCNFLKISPFSKKSHLISLF